MLSQEYFGFHGLQNSANRLIGRRTQLSETKINNSKSKEKFKIDQLQLQKLKQKYIIKKNSRSSKQLYRRNKKCYSMHSHDLKFRYFHYNDHGNYSHNKQIKKRVEKRALETLQRNLTPESQLSAKNGLVNTNHSRHLEQNLLSKKNSREICQLIDNKKQNNNNHQILTLKNISSMYNIKSVSNLSQRNFKKLSCQQKKYTINQNNFGIDQYYLNPKKKVSNLLLNSQHLGPSTTKKPDKPSQEQIHKQQQMMEISLNSRQDNSQEQSKSNNQSRLQPKVLTTSDYDIIKRLEEKAKQEEIEENHIHVESNHQLVVPERNSGKKLSQLGIPSKLVSSSEHSISHQLLEQSIKFQFLLNNSSSSNSNPNKKNLQHSPFFKNESKYHSLPNKMLPNNTSNDNNLLMSLSSSNKFQQKIQKQFTSNQEYQKNYLTINQHNFDKSFQYNNTNKLIPSFNLLESLKKLSNTQNKKMSHLYSVFRIEDEKLQIVIDKLYSHLSCLNKIQDFVQQTEEFYVDNQQRQLFHQCSYLLLQKSYEQKQKIIDYIKQGKSCFNLTGRQISDEEFCKQKQTNTVKQFCQYIQQSNKQLQKILQKFSANMRYQQGLNSTILNRKQLTKQNIYYIIQKLYEQLQLLINKIDDNQQQSIYLKDNEYEVISLRCFALMELTFLISQLSGRKIKKMEHSIQPEEFQLYFKANYGMFKETVLYFH